MWRVLSFVLQKENTGSAIGLERGNGGSMAANNNSIANSNISMVENEGDIGGVNNASANEGDSALSNNSSASIMENRYGQTLRISQHHALCTSTQQAQQIQCYPELRMRVRCCT